MSVTMNQSTMRATDTSERTVFYSAQFHYRSWRMVGVILLIPFFCLFPALAAIRGMPGHGRSGAMYWFAVVLSILMLLVFLSALRRFVTAATNDYRIDEAGVQVGKRRLPWNEITWIGTSPADRRGAVFIAVSDQTSPKIRSVLHPDKPLSPKEYLDVINTLRPWLRAHAPHVTIEPFPPG
jgi:hypothetical protein